MFELQKILLQAVANRPDAPEINACIYREIGLAAVADALGVKLSDIEPEASPSRSRNDAIVHVHPVAA
ncbi:MAG: hypothetical protein KGM42_16795 [Hyphomicrobiales bacterium]|nr:hypothetical protein [Hyphomicrobiales bacterium]